MKKWTVAMAGVLAFSTLAVAKPANEKDERERMANAGRVMKEILDVPDDIPKTFWTRPAAWWCCLLWLRLRLW